MVIPGDEIVSKSIVGKLGDNVLTAIATCGGLHLIESRSPDGKREVIGAGSHRAIAKYIAKRNNPNLEWTVLEKSTEAQFEDFKDVLPFWEEVTKRARNG